MKVSQKQKLRNALLASVHIAKKETGIDDAVYRIILHEEYGVESAGKLSIEELKNLIDRFESKGWKPKGRSQKPEARSQKDGQVEALKERIGQEILGSELTEDRLRGLVRKICNVDDLRWCADAVRLRQLLAIIGRMKDAGEI